MRNPRVSTVRKRACTGARVHTCHISAHLHRHSCSRLLGWPTWWCAHVQKTWRVVRVETGVIHPRGHSITIDATISSDPVAALRAMWADREARTPPS